MEPNLSDVKRLAAAREEFILKREKLLGRKLTQMESILLDQVLGKFVTMLSNDRGIVTYKGSMITVTQAIDRIFDDFMKNENLQVVRSMVTDLAQLSVLNAKYYGAFTARKSHVDDIKARNDKEMMNRIGLGTDNKLVKSGFLDSFVHDTTLRDFLKLYVYKAVTGGAPFQDFIKGLKTIITGAPQQDSMLAKHYKTFAFDTYSQFDASNGNLWRQELKLRAALYAGGLIETSREFCVKNNNKVFTVEEMEAWKDRPDLPRTVEEKRAGHTIGYIGYIDRGRWRCRHQINWISKQLAIRLRPDLKEYFETAL